MDTTIIDSLVDTFAARIAAYKKRAEEAEAVLMDRAEERLGAAALAAMAERFPPRWPQGKSLQITEIRYDPARPRATFAFTATFDYDELEVRKFVEGMRQGFAGNLFSAPVHIARTFPAAADIVLIPNSRLMFGETPVTSVRVIGGHPGQTMVLEFIQDAVGGRTISGFDRTVLFRETYTPTPTAYKRDRLTFTWDDPGSRWVETNREMGLGL